MIRIQSKKGFGLVEVMITTVIIALVLGAVVKVGIAGMNNTSASIKKYQATLLVQEGLERVRQIRDTNWIDGDADTAWDSLLGSGTNPLHTLSYSNYRLKYDTAGKRFFLEADSVSNPAGEQITVGNEIFKRVMRVDNYTTMGTLLPSSDSYSDNMIKVTATVSWENNARSISSSEIITNWRPNF